MFTRKKYLNNEVTHDQYYSQFVDHDTKQYVKQRIGLDNILKSNDEHFNDIPLKHWDTCCVSIESVQALKDAGDSWTLSGRVCIAKAAAKIIKSEV